MIKELSRQEFESASDHGMDLKNILNDHLGILINNFWTTSETSRLRQKVLTNRNKWKYFKGKLNYYALGAPLYGYRATNDLDSYFEQAIQNDYLIKNEFPDLEKNLVTDLQSMFPKVKLRRKKFHSGPGFVIQDSNSKHYPHFDIHESVFDFFNLHSRPPALITAVGMIKKPKKGGGLLYWDEQYDFKEEYQVQIKKITEKSPQTIDTPEGGLLLINGLILHEIEPCSEERITFVTHLSEIENDLWEYWL